MSKQNKRKGKLRKGQPVLVSGLGMQQQSQSGTGGGLPTGCYTQNNVQFNQNLLLPDNCVTALQVLAGLPSNMHAEALAMAKKEQEHRHRMEEDDMQKYYELSASKQKLDDDQVSRSQRYIFISEMTGKIIGFVYIFSVAAAILYMAAIGNYKGIAAVTTVAALLGGGGVWLFRLLLRNANVPVQK